jgi:uridine phosphorylase
LAEESVPPVCILDFDGDLTKRLAKSGAIKLFRPWACFHTTMYTSEVQGRAFGMVPQTIGGPYAVLVAEQLRVSGAQVVIGLTSAGRVLPAQPVPSLVVATSAVRDEGTSFHYLPPAEAVEAPPGLPDLLTEELAVLGLPVTKGLLWTTDAPYRETQVDLAHYAEKGVLAVEMQAASLFAFATARRVLVGVVAHVTNAVDLREESFDKGAEEREYDLLMALCRAGSHAHRGLRSGAIQNTGSTSHANYRAKDVPAIRPKSLSQPKP